MKRKFGLILTILATSLITLLCSCGEECAHKYEVVSTVDATCTEEGNITYLCPLCNDSYTETVAASHDVENHEAKAPTCTEGGWDAYETCKREGCDYSTKIEKAALSHDIENHEAKAPTCTEVGWDAYEACKREGCEYSTKIEKAALSHDIENHEAKEPACTEGGWDAYETCKREGCEYSTKIEKAALSHDIENYEAKAPSCTEAGWDAYEACKREGCEYSTKIEKAALSHDIENYEAKEPTCTEIGWNAYEACKREGCEYSTKIEKKSLGHDVETHEANPPSCDQEGWYEYETCKREGCNYSTKLVHDPLNHDIKYCDAKAPTCTEVGWNAYEYCTREDCYYTTKVELEPFGHDLKEQAGKAPTCTESGWDSFAICKRDGCDYCTKIVMRKPLKHDLAYCDAKAPTCTEVGWNAYEYCTREDCHYTTKTEIEAMKHDLENYEAKEPTCTESGWDAHEACKRDGCEYSTKIEKAALSHDIEYYEEKESTCTEKGWYAYEACKRDGCGYSTKIEKAEFSHDLEYFAKQDSTCTEDGWEAYERCKRDNCDYTTYVKIPGGHNYTAIVTPPACTLEGYTTYVCSKCKDSYVDPDSKVPPTGCTMGNWYVYEPVSATSNGTMKQNCQNCSLFNTRKAEVVSSGIMGYNNDNANNPPTNSATYEIFEDGTMRIKGTGKLYRDTWLGDKQPYKNYREFVTRIIICEGITETGIGNFRAFTSLETVEFPSTLSYIRTNTFMDAFASHVKTFTIPATVKRIDNYAFGPYRPITDDRVFTDIIIENPDILLCQSSADIECTTSSHNAVFSGKPEYNEYMSLYSYGKNNNVQKYAEFIGAKYYDINDTVKGNVENVGYIVSAGTLELSAIDSDKEATLPESTPWFTNTIKASDITNLVIGDGIKDIPANYFKDYTSLTSIKLSETVETIGSRAFSTSASCIVPLNINFPKTLKSVGEKMFENRAGVVVDGFYDSVYENYKEDGVTLNLFKSFKILLIGNSLSGDACDSRGQGTESQLYNIIKSMLGENSYVEIGHLYQGARSATWYATMAETNQARIQFSIISDKTGGVWKKISDNATMMDGITHTKWDCVTIQPYANEASTGVGHMSWDNKDDCNEKDEKFLALSASLPYLLDYVETYSAGASVYYFSTWATHKGVSEVNIGADTCLKLLSVAKTAVTYKGTTTEKAFSGIIPGGLAIQNARTTYLALLGYTPPETSPNVKNDNQNGLLRDDVHASYSLGRYIVGLTMAEIVVPEKLREENYVLPGVADSIELGALPQEYTEIARKAVYAALESAKLSGDAQYSITKIEGYDVDPANRLASEISSMSFAGMAASSISELEEKIATKISEKAPDGTVISVKVNGTALSSSFSATVTVRFGYTIKTLTVNGTN